MCPDSSLATTPQPVVVDVSNIVRDTRVGDPSVRTQWARLQMLSDGLELFFGRAIEVIAVADRSLRPLLSGPDRAEYRNLEEAGRLRTVDVADEEILNVSERTGCLVVSNDRFRGHRKERPWIQGNDDRFLGWNVGQDGALSIERRRMGWTAESMESRFAEVGDLKGRGIDAKRTTQRAVLSGLWKCTQRGCLLARLYPDHLVSPPVLRGGGEPECPGCGHPLELVGERPPSRAAVLSLGEDEVGRVLLDPGDVVVLDARSIPAICGGSSATAEAIGLDAAELRMSLDGSLTLRSLANPVRVRQGATRFREFQPGADVALQSGTRVTLGSSLVVRASGRRWPW